jgi:glutamate-5-semialdehyde dehydrogenase
MVNLTEMGKNARQAARRLATTPTDEKNAALTCLADLLVESQTAILAANQKDLEEASHLQLSASMLDRLTLNPDRLASMAADVMRVVEIPDPVEDTFEHQVLPNGLKVHKQRVPLGVLAVIYESRPNVTVDVTGLALKSGNAAILRGGSETIHTNRVLVEVIQKALIKTGLPEQSIQFISEPDRKLVLELLKMHEYVDLVIPRGGAGLHRFCKENSMIPVVVGGIGICHLYVDETANFDKALDIIFNAKTQRPTVCNALDTILVHESIAKSFVPKVLDRLGGAGVTFRIEEPTLQILDLNADIRVQAAGRDDFDTEWLALILGIKLVSNIDEAIDHIAAHSTGHSDGILTQDEAAVEKFVNLVDSAVVYVNASTRFTDGGQLGLGAEVAVSTQRLHARGPMGLTELTTYKWVVKGEWHVRD